MPENAPSTPVSPWTDALLDQMRQVQDPVADDFLKQVVDTEGQPQARQIFDVLIHHIGIDLPNLPDYAAEYFAQTAQLPEWADPAKIAMGQKVFADFGPSMMALLYFKALPTTYLPLSTSKVLTRTGRLADSEDKQARFGRRVGETAQFVLDVMGGGNLKPGGKGIRTTQKIRLIHASIRYFLPKEQWDEAAWQKVINQEDMAITILTFSVSMLDGLEQLGIAVSEAQAEAYLHTWNVVAHLLGISPELQPRDIADGRALLEKILRRHQTQSEDGIQLTQALVHFAEEMMPGKILDNIGSLMIAYYIGNERAAMLGINNNTGCLGLAVPLFFRKLIGMTNRLEDSSTSAEKISDQAGRLIMKGMVRAVRKAKGAAFDFPEDLKAKWDLDSE